MTAKHTPGPWHIDGHEVHAGDGCEFVTTFDPSTAVGTANARLIAAAPELLDTLKEALRVMETAGWQHPFNLHYHDDCDLSCAVVRARAVIAKAEGR